MINNIVDNSHHVVDATIAMTGDLVLDVPDPDHWLAGIAPVLQAADVAIGHLEVPHTHRGSELKGDVPAPGADPEALQALPRAGFTAVSLAGNHIADRGEQGIEDTIDGLVKAGLAFCGAGTNLQQARQPALIECRGRRIALLSYNCVGPENSWATNHRAGCAYLAVETEDGGPVTPATSIAGMTMAAKHILEKDIGAARQLADLVIVALHKGIVHTPARLGPYERPLAHTAVDAGADVVIGHHAHIIKGIEIYRDKPIFHGLGNGCVVTRALRPDQAHRERAAWAERRKQLFGFEPDPAYELAPFHPEAINAMIGYVSWPETGPLVAGIIPVHVEPPGRPVLANAARSGEIARYVERITLEAGLPAIRLNCVQDLWVVT
jgi:poly-gamma-glutamate capsule biosynthesis protein CapA/YwtB (metallophosphatase superfamily)